MKTMDRLPGTAALLAALCLHALTAQAATTTWFDATSNWAKPINWSTGSVPTPIDDANINNGGTAQITSSDTAKSLTLGSSANNSGTVSISGPGGLLTLTPVAPVGNIIGGDGVGTVNISNGGKFDFGNLSLLLGSGSKGSGTVNIDGMGSLLFSSNR